MNRWNPLNRVAGRLNAVMDEILQFACVACQAVPWLQAVLSRQPLR